MLTAGRSGGDMGRAKAGLGADRPVIGAPMDRSWQPESCRAGLRRATWAAARPADRRSRGGCRLGGG